MRRTDPPTGCLVLLLIAGVVGGIGMAIVRAIVWIRLAFGDLL